MNYSFGRPHLLEYFEGHMTDDSEIFKGMIHANLAIFLIKSGWVGSKVIPQQSWYTINYARIS
jgi:hypothetical protein